MDIEEALAVLRNWLLEVAESPDGHDQGKPGAGSPDRS